MSFTFFAEPGIAVGGTDSDRSVLTGLGDADGSERAFIAINEAGSTSAIELTRDELESLIVDLVHTLSAMGARM